MLYLSEFRISTESISDSVIIKTLFSSGSNRVAIAYGCSLETIDNRSFRIVVGANAEFYHSRSTFQTITFEHFWNANKGQYGAEQVYVPADLEMSSFNWHSYKWKEQLISTDMVQKGQVHVAKTIRGNYVVFQKTPYKAVFVGKNGQIEENNKATFGDAEVFVTPYFSLENAKNAVSFCENILAERQEEWAKKQKEKLAKLAESCEGYYHVQLPCEDKNLNEKWTNWQVYGKSGVDAYANAVKMARSKGYISFSEITEQFVQIQFVGILASII